MTVDPLDLLAFAHVPLGCQCHCVGAVAQVWPTRFLLFHFPPIGCSRGGPHYSQALLQWDPCPGSTVAQERPQSILWSLEEVSSYQRCACFFKTGEISPSNPCPDSPKSPSSVTFFSLFPPVPFCLPGVDGNGKSPSKSELHHLYLTEKYVWRWKQFLSRRGKRTSPLDLKLGHNNWLRQVSGPAPGPCPAARPQILSTFPHLLCFCSFSLLSCKGICGQHYFYN